MAESNTEDSSQDSPDREVPSDETIQRKRFDVYVQWKRGERHRHEESIRASDIDTALMLAKRNIDIRLEPVSLRVVPRTATRSTKLDDPSLVPSTDRSYRNSDGYFTRDVNPPNASATSSND